MSYVEETLREHNRELAAVDKALVKLNKTVDFLKSELARVDPKRVCEELEGAKTENERLRKELDAAQAQNLKLQAELDRLRTSAQHTKELENMKKKLRELKAMFPDCFL